jgi:murein DD-endopeptidase MepM/ murein hydrolase activator NlpD
MSSLYAHVDDLRVAVAQLIHGDTVLSVVGSSGGATGPHLHCEVRAAGSHIDPLAGVLRQAYKPTPGRAYDFYKNFYSLAYPPMITFCGVVACERILLTRTAGSV